MLEDGEQTEEDLRRDQRPETGKGASGEQRLSWPTHWSVRAFSDVNFTA